MFKGFREFILRGNVLDLAVGIIIGAAFTAIVNSIVQDLINPLLGLVVGGRTDFTGYYLPLAGQAGDTLELAQANGPVFAYGAFLTAVINFTIIAFVLFLIIRLVTHMRRKEAAASAAPSMPTEDQKLLGEIRDLLRAARPMDVSTTRTNGVAHNERAAGTTTT